MESGAHGRVTKSVNASLLALTNWSCWVCSHPSTPLPSVSLWATEISFQLCSESICFKIDSFDAQWFYFLWIVSVCAFHLRRKFPKHKGFLFCLRSASKKYFKRSSNYTNRWFDSLWIKEKNRLLWFITVCLRTAFTFEVLKGKQDNQKKSAIPQDNELRYYNERYNKCRVVFAYATWSLLWFYVMFFIMWVYRWKNNLPSVTSSLVFYDWRDLQIFIHGHRFEEL